MTYQEYITALQKAKLQNENIIGVVIPSFEDYSVGSLLGWMDSNLDVKAGSLVSSKETVKILNEFDSAFLKALNGFDPYNGAVSKYLKNLSGISGIMKTYQEDVGSIDWAKVNVKPAQNLVVNEILQAYTDNGLNVNFVQPLRDILYQNISAGTNFAQAKEIVSDYITGGKDKSGKLDKYLTQTAQQGVDSYEGAINQKLMQTFKYPYLLMAGSLIETSSPQCVYCIKQLDGVISREDWDNKVKPLAEKNGLIEGTTFESVTFNKLHWGCRHSFAGAFLKPKR